jgi:hypothetical protein
MLLGVSYIKIYEKAALIYTGSLFLINVVEAEVGTAS